MSKRDLFGLFLLASGWGPTFLLIKIGVESFSPLFVTTIRCASAALLMIGYCLLTKRSFKPVFPYWKDILFMAVVGNIIPFYACAYAETMVQSSTAGIIEGTVPIITALFTVLFTPHQKLPKEQILGVALGFVGIVIIFAPDLLQHGSSTEERFLGKGLLVVMAIFFSASFVYSKERLENVPHIPCVALQMIIVTLILLPITFAVEGFQSFGNLTLSNSWALILLGTYGTAFPWCVYFYLIKRGGAAQVSLAVYLLPVVAIILGKVFLDEVLRWNLALGTAVILLSLLLAGGMISKKRIRNHDNPLLKS